MCHPPYRDRGGDTETSQDRFGSREESKLACYPEMKKRVERELKKVKKEDYQIYLEYQPAHLIQVHNLLRQNLKRKNLIKIILEMKLIIIKVIQNLKILKY